MSEPKTGRDGSPAIDGIVRAVGENVTAESATVVQSGVRSVTAASVEVRQSAVQRLNAERASMDDCAIASARVREATLKKSMAVTLVAGSVSAEECNTVFLLSPSVKGNVRAVVTPAAALAFGAGYYLGRKLLGGLLARRRG